MFSLEGRNWIKDFFFHHTELRVEYDTTIRNGLWVNYHCHSKKLNGFYLLSRILVVGSVFISSKKWNCIKDNWFPLTFVSVPLLQGKSTTPPAAGPHSTTVPSPPAILLFPSLFSFNLTWRGESMEKVVSVVDCFFFFLVGVSFSLQQHFQFLGWKTRKSSPSHHHDQWCTTTTALSAWQLCAQLRDKVAKADWKKIKRIRGQIEIDNFAGKWMQSNAVKLIMGDNLYFPRLSIFEWIVFF